MLIQKLRLQRAWSQQHLAQVSGLSLRTIQRLENGQPASLESLKALAAAFDTDVTTLQSPEMSTHSTSTPNALLATAQASAEEEAAFAHVRALGRYYRALAVYGVAMLTLFVVHLVTDQSRPWMLAVAGIWGGVLLLRGLRLHQKLPWGVAWEKRQVEKHLQRKL